MLGLPIHFLFMSSNSNIARYQKARYWILDQVYRKVSQHRSWTEWTMHWAHRDWTPLRFSPWCLPLSIISSFITVFTLRLLYDSNWSDVWPGEIGLTTHATMMFDQIPASDFNPMRDVWFPLDLSNAASFNAIMAHSAAHLAYHYGGTAPTRGTNSFKALSYKAHAVEILSHWLSNPEQALSNDAFAAVVRLLTFEVCFSRSNRTHMAYWRRLCRDTGAPKKNGKSIETD